MYTQFRKALTRLCQPADLRFVFLPLSYGPTPARLLATCHTPASGGSDPGEELILV